MRLKTLIGCALALTLAAGAASADNSPEMQKVIAGAKAEGKLNIIWSATTLGGSAGAKRFEAGINKMFGTDIKISFTPGPSMPNVGNQIATETQAGRKTSTDVYLAYSRTVALLAKLDLFEPVDWKALLPGRITEANVEAGGRSIKAVTALPGILYNTQLVPYKPTALSDFLKPEWKGKIASTPYAANFDILSAKDSWGPEKALDYAKKLSPQLAGLIRCDDVNRIATGEFLAFFITCTGNEGERIKEQGAPVDEVAAKDFVIQSFFYFQVPRAAENPNAAKLFVTFAMTPEGQAIVWDTWQSDLSLFPESHTRKDVERTEKDYGVKLKELDLAWQAANSDTQETWDQIVKILTTKN